MMTKPYVVALSGGTCSGKSTLTEMLEKQFEEVALKSFQMDDYFKATVPTTIAPITRKEYPEHNHPDTLELERFFADLQSACEDSTIQLILVEGIFSLYFAEIREKADFKVFVDLPSDERLVRRLRRFSQCGQVFDEIAERYLDTVRFRHEELVEPTRWHADMIVNGTLDTGKGAEIVIDYIKNRLIERGYLK